MTGWKARLTVATPDLSPAWSRAKPVSRVRPKSVKPPASMRPSVSSPLSHVPARVMAPSSVFPGAGGAAVADGATTVSARVDAATSPAARRQVWERSA